MNRKNKFVVVSSAFTRIRAMQHFPAAFSKMCVSSKNVSQVNGSSSGIEGTAATEFIIQFREWLSFV